MPSSSGRNNEFNPLLEGILSNAQIPHQPLLVVEDGATFGGVPLFREIISRSSRRGETPTLVTTLHPPETFLPSSSSSSSSTAKVVDLTSSIPGYDSSLTIKEVEHKILSDYTGGQIFVDSLDILAEDYTPSATLRLVRNILEVVRSAKAPSRLVVLLSPSSTLYSTLISATFSSTLSLLIPHPPGMVSHLSKQYLSPISTNPSPNLWMILVNASKRRLADELAWKAEQGIEFDPSWTTAKGAVIQVLVRKSTGGIKGISRSLEGVASGAATANAIEGVRVVPLEQLVELNPLATAPTDPIAGRQAATHAELDLPFNLNLTDAQRRQRGAVPLPYAHEGEGASGDLIWEDEEETDDEEI